MSDTPEDNVLPFRKIVDNNHEPTVSDTLRRSFSQSLDQFTEDAGKPPTCALYVFMDDEGRFRVGWDTTRSPLPANAIIGMAITSLINGTSPHSHE